MDFCRNLLVVVFRTRFTGAAVRNTGEIAMKMKKIHFGCDVGTCAALAVWALAGNRVPPPARAR